MRARRMRPARSLDRSARRARGTGAVGPRHRPRYPRGSMAVRSASRSASAAHVRPAKWTVPPVLVRQVRNGTVESVHRGDIVEVDAAGRMLHLLGDPDRIVNLRSAMKPFGLIALLRAGGRREFDLTTEELAVMTSSHSGEDVHVRTVQALFRRLAIPQSVLACGTEGMPLDALTAARLARDGERPLGAAAHVLGPALGVRAARQARRLGARDVLAGRPPGAGGRARRDRRGVRRRPGAHQDGRSTAAGSSPTPSRCARSPARSRSSPIRRASRPATRAAALAPYYVEIRDAMLAVPGARRRDARPPRHLADEGRRPAAA